VSRPTFCSYLVCSTLFLISLTYFLNLRTTFLEDARLIWPKKFFLSYLVYSTPLPSPPLPCPRGLELAIGKAAWDMGWPNGQAARRIGCGDVLEKHCRIYWPQNGSRKGSPTWVLAKKILLVSWLVDPENRFWPQKRVSEGVTNSSTSQKNYFSILVSWPRKWVLTPKTGLGKGHPLEY